MPSSARFWVRACYDFISSEDGDLSFRDGDIMKVEEVSSRNWLIVSRAELLAGGGREGLPKCYVLEKEDGILHGPCTTLVS